MWFSKLRSKMQVRTVVRAFVSGLILIPYSTHALPSRSDPSSLAVSARQLQRVDADGLARGAAAASFPQIGDSSAERNHPLDGTLVAGGTHPSSPREDKGDGKSGK